MTDTGTSDRTQSHAGAPSTRPSRLRVAVDRVASILPARIRTQWPAIPSIVALVFAIVFVVKGHVFFMRPFPISVNVDEQYLNAFAIRMIDGHWLPYVDAVSHRGPVIYWLMALVVKIFGWSDWMPVRVTAMSATLLEAILVFVIGWMGRRPLAGALAALSVPLVQVAYMDPLHGIGLNGEMILNGFLLPALLLLVVGLDVRRPKASSVLVAFAGGLASLGALSKQTGAAQVIPLLVWVLAVAVVRDGLTRRQRLWIIGSFGIGLLVPALLVAIRYLVAGELHTMYYWMITYNADVYMSPFTPELRAKVTKSTVTDNLLLLGLGIAVLFALIGRCFVGVTSIKDVLRKYDSDPLGPTVGLGAIAGLLAAHAALRGWGHYYVQAVPWCGLAIGIFVEDALVQVRPRIGVGYFVAQLVVLGPVLFLSKFAVAQHLDTLNQQRNGREVGDPRNDSMCAALGKYSQPNDYVFIWGFRPEFYTSCHRRPASRFVYTTMVAGLVPWFNGASKEEDEHRAAPGSRDNLIADLEATRPSVIVDWPDSLGKRSMRRYPVLLQYIQTHYCTAETVRGIEFLVRRSPDGTCKPAQ